MPLPSRRAAELLVGVEPDAAPAAMDSPSSSNAASGGRLLHLHRSGGSSFRHRTRPGGGGGSSSELGTPLGGVSYVNTPIPDDDAFDTGGDKYLLAKTYFDCREYRRVAHVLQNQGGRKAVFLRCYALYMVRWDQLDFSLVVFIFLVVDLEWGVLCLMKCLSSVAT
jgi:anaphase-promoting complex subunit 8